MLVSSALVEDDEKLTETGGTDNEEEVPAVDDEFGWISLVTANGSV